LSLVQNARLTVSDLLRFGPTAVGRHFARLKKDRLAKVHVRGIGPVLVRTGDSDMAALRQVFTAREYDFTSRDPTNRRVQARYRSVLAAGGSPIIVDAGANIGAASLAFASQFPEARIVAVEPDPANAALLRRNLEGRANCRIVEAAVGAERGFVALHNDCPSWAVRTERSQSGVPVITIEDAFAQSGGDTPFIVKIDIEGFEKDLFASNTGWIERSYVVVIEPHDWMLPGEFSSRSFQEAMVRHPFEVCIRGENLLYVQA
jgi:FkbM family methyltransferase